MLDLTSGLWPFPSLHIPSKKLPVGKSQFQSVLQEMYDLDEGDDGIVFSKNQGIFWPKRAVFGSKQAEIRGVLSTVPCYKAPWGEFLRSL